jgi:hypothetical protein
MIFVVSLVRTAALGSCGSLEPNLLALRARDHYAVVKRVKRKLRAASR